MADMEFLWRVSTHKTLPSHPSIIEHSNFCHFCRYAFLINYPPNADIPQPRQNYTWGFSVNNKILELRPTIGILYPWWNGAWLWVENSGIKLLFGIMNFLGKKTKRFNFFLKTLKSADFVITTSLFRLSATRLYANYRPWFFRSCKFVNSIMSHLEAPTAHSLLVFLNS